MIDFFQGSQYLKIWNNWATAEWPVGNLEFRQAHTRPAFSTVASFHMRRKNEQVLCIEQMLFKRLFFLMAK